MVIQTVVIMILQNARTAMIVRSVRLVSVTSKVI